jgi:hypothetical protein
VIRRTPLTRGKPLVAKKPLAPGNKPLTSKKPVKPVSAKRSAESTARSDVIVATMRRADWKCEAGDMAFGIRCGEACDVHEIIQRSVRPGSHLEVELTAFVCRPHHSAIDDNIEEANRLGLYFMSWEYDLAVARRALPIPGTHSASS